MSPSQSVRGSKLRSSLEGQAKMCRPGTIRILLLLISLACLPSLFASGVVSPVVLTLSGGSVSSGSLSISSPPGSPGAVGVWEISGQLAILATNGTVTVTYDYSNSSAGGMWPGQTYDLSVSADDEFWSADRGIFLSSLNLTSTISRCFNSPCPPNSPWSVSANYDVGPYALGSFVSPLVVVGGSSVSAQIPYSSTFGFDQTSTMTFTNVQVGDLIYIDLPDRTELDPTPEPATFWLAGLAGAGFMLLRRRALR